MIIVSLPNTSSLCFAAISLLEVHGCKILSQTFFTHVF
jgi:hypothetical protein